MVSLSLSWLLHHTAVDCIILGASSMEQLNQNLAAGEMVRCQRTW
jgi:aryl-alcohol dehydrogenase-like predicted oxidoreductase